METTKKKQEDELLNKREVLSEEDLMKVAGGGFDSMCELYIRTCDYQYKYDYLRKICYKKKNCTDFAGL